jgi:hypothetical protein
MGEVRGRAYKKDSVAIDETRHAGDVDLIGWGRAGYQVDLDAKIGACLAECCVASLWENPTVMLVLRRYNGKFLIHLRLGYTPLRIRLLSGTQTCHQN